MSSIRRTPSQLHSLHQIPTQHDMLPQHLVYKNEINREYVVTLARNDETPWWWSEKIETCRSGFRCFKWKLYRCICWLIVEVTPDVSWWMWQNHGTMVKGFFVVCHDGKEFLERLNRRESIWKIPRQNDASRRENATNVCDYALLFLQFRVTTAPTRCCRIS